MYGHGYRSAWPKRERKWGLSFKLRKATTYTYIHKRERVGREKVEGGMGWHEKGIMK